jgi:hypothetical protein
VYTGESGAALGIVSEDPFAPVRWLMKAMQQLGERGDPSEANEMLGAPTTTLRRWCEEQRLHVPDRRSGHQ